MQMTISYKLCILMTDLDRTVEVFLSLKGNIDHTMFYDFLTLVLTLSVALLILIHAVPAGLWISMFSGGNCSSKLMKRNCCPYNTVNDHLFSILVYLNISFTAPTMLHNSEICWYLSYCSMVHCHLYFMADLCIQST